MSDSSNEQKEFHLQFLCSQTLRKGTAMRGLILFIITTVISMPVWAQEYPNETAVDENSEESEQGNQEYKDGVEHFEAGNYELAASSFREAYEKSKITSIYYEIGQVEYFGKLHGRALEALETYMELMNPNDIPKRHEKKISKLMDELKPLVAMVIVKMPERCAIEINNFNRGQGPLSKPVYVNTHEAQVVVVKCNNEIQYKKTYLLKKGQTVNIDATKKHNEDQPVAKNPAKFADSPSLDKKSIKIAPAPTKSIPSIVLPIVAAATSAVLIGTSIILDAEVKQRADNIEYGGQSSAYFDTTNNMQTGSRIVGVIGLVGAGVSTWLFMRYLKHKKKNEQFNALHVVPILRAQVNGVAVEGRF